MTPKTSQTVSLLVGESLLIGEGESAVTIHVRRARRGAAILAITAPAGVLVDRSEVRERREAAARGPTG